MNLVIFGIRPDLPTCNEHKFHVSASMDGKHNVPVAASIMSKSVVMREKKRMAVARTDRVGQRLIKGAMRMAPTH